MPLSTNDIPANYGIQIAVDGEGVPVYARVSADKFNSDTDSVLLNGVIIPWQSLITFDPNTRLV